MKRINKDIATKTPNPKNYFCGIWFPIAIGIGVLVAGKLQHLDKELYNNLIFNINAKSVKMFQVYKSLVINMKRIKNSILSRCLYGTT